MNKFVYEKKEEVEDLELDLGETSNVVNVKTDLLFSSFRPEVYKDMTFVADPQGERQMTFFSTRGAYKLMDGLFSYIETKGCGVPNRGISQEYFLEDGRDKDEVHDPIGGLTLSRALIEWQMLEKLSWAGVKTHVPIALLKLNEIRGLKGEDLALLIRSGKSNIRLSYLENRVLENIEEIRENALYQVGKNISIMHKELGLCHNALHEENITLNGEIVDLEYASNATVNKVYRDIWYGLLSFAEIFGTPLKVSEFIRGYSNKKLNFTINGTMMSEMEQDSRAVAEKILKV